MKTRFMLLFACLFCCVVGYGQETSQGEGKTDSTSYTADYFWNGWLKRVISQTKSVFAKNGKLKQTFIECESAAMGNY